MPRKPAAFCPPCQERIAASTDALSYEVCQRCWDLCIELPMEHGHDCDNPSCRQTYRETARVLYAKWGEPVPQEVSA